MSNLGAARAVLAALESQAYADAAQEITDDTGPVWGGVSIGPLVEARLGDRQHIGQCPGAIMDPSAFDVLQMEHGGCDDNQHSFVVRLSERRQDGDATKVREQLMAHVWVVRHVIFKEMDATGKFWRARVSSVDYGGATPLPDGPSVASADITVDITANESNETVLD